ncbi:hypothetical protein KBH77_04975 [Patescibacteria group bacterium]|nr:hypothetical protein [Patescibacteria group bacterium]
MKKIIFLDLDGVARDSVRYVCNQYGVDLPKKYNEKINNKSFSELIDEKASVEAPPTIFFDGILNICSQYGVKRYYISNNPYIKQNADWVLKHDREGIYIPVLKTVTKAEIVEDIVERIQDEIKVVIIDDCFQEIENYIKTLATFISQGTVILLLPDYPYNQSNKYEGRYFRFHNPKELCDRIYNFYSESK